MASTIFTYKQIPKSIIEVHWTLSELDIPIENNEPIKEVPGWQKNKDIEISLDIYAKSEDIQSYIRPDRSASFYLTFHSRLDKEGTSLHGLIAQIPLNFKKGNTRITGNIDGSKIAGYVDVTFSICIDDEIEYNSKENIDPFLASDIGSIIYEESKTLILEGDASFFPVADIDFAKHNLPTSALYFLQRKHKNLDVDFSTAYRLYFNNTHPKFNLINEMHDSEAKEILLDMIIYDVYKQLVTDALNNEDFEIPNEDNPDLHTVRFVYARLLQNIQKNYYDNEPLSSLREKSHSEDSSVRNYFNCALQDFFLTLGDK